MVKCLVHFSEDKAAVWGCGWEGVGGRGVSVCVGRCECRGVGVGVGVGRCGHVLTC